MVRAMACGQGLPYVSGGWWEPCVVVAMLSGVNNCTVCSSSVAAGWQRCGVVASSFAACRQGCCSSQLACSAGACVCCVCGRASQLPWAPLMCAAHLVGSTYCVCGEGPMPTCRWWQRCARFLQLRQEPAVGAVTSRAVWRPRVKENVAKAWVCVCGVGRPGVRVFGWVGVLLVCACVCAWCAAWLCGCRQGQELHAPDDCVSIP